MAANLRSIRRNHHGESGRRREDDVRDFLRAYLPRRFGVDTGEIVATDGSVSPQMDIIIWDAFETPLFDRSQSSIQIPIEGVYAVIEISTNLNGPKLAEDVEKIRQVKKMPKVAYFNASHGVVTRHTLWGRQFDHFPVLGFCFGLKSIQLSNLSNRLAVIDDADDLANNVDLICSLESGCIANATRGSGLSVGFTKLQGQQSPGQVRCIVEDKTSEAMASALMYFYLLGCGLVVQARTAPIRLAAYI